MIHYLLFLTTISCASELSPASKRSEAGRNSNRKISSWSGDLSSVEKMRDSELDSAFLKRVVDSRPQDIGGVLYSIERKKGSEELKEIIQSDLSSSSMFASPAATSEVYEAVLKSLDKEDDIWRNHRLIEIMVRSSDKIGEKFLENMKRNKIEILSLSVDKRAEVVRDVCNSLFGGINKNGCLLEIFKLFSGLGEDKVMELVDGIDLRGVKNDDSNNLIYQLVSSEGNHSGAIEFLIRKGVDPFNGSFNFHDYYSEEDVFTDDERSIFYKVLQVKKYFYLDVIAPSPQEVGYDSGNETFSKRVAMICRSNGVKALLCDIEPEILGKICDLLLEVDIEDGIFKEEGMFSLFGKFMIKLQSSHKNFLVYLRKLLDLDDVISLFLEPSDNTPNFHYSKDGKVVSTRGCSIFHAAIDLGENMKGEPSEDEAWSLVMDLIKLDIARFMKKREGMYDGSGRLFDFAIQSDEAPTFIAQDYYQIERSQRGDSVLARLALSGRYDIVNEIFSHDKYLEAVTERYLAAQKHLIEILIQDREWDMLEKFLELKEAKESLSMRNNVVAPTMEIIRPNGEKIETKLVHTLYYYGKDSLVLKLRDCINSRSNNNNLGWKLLPKTDSRNRDFQDLAKLGVEDKFREDANILAP